MIIPPALRKFLIFGYTALFLVLAFAIYYYNPYLLSSTKTYKGTFSTNFEMSAFVPDGSNERWWLKENDDNPVLPIPPEPAAQRVYFFAGSQTYLVVEGKVTRKGKFGHLGKYDREFTITRLVSSQELVSSK